MYYSHHDPSMSKSMGQIPFSYRPQVQNPSQSPSSSHASRERVSISNLIYAVDNTQISATSPALPPSGRVPARNRKVPERNRAKSSHGSRGPLGRAESEEAAALRRKIQSEKKREWRKNLSPDQKAKRQELDAQRKREQRMNMTPDQKLEARRKDAARKAAKRRIQKEMNSRLVGEEPEPTPIHGLPPARPRPDISSQRSNRNDFNRSKIDELLN